MTHTLRTLLKYQRTAYMNKNPSDILIQTDHTELRYGTSTNVHVKW